LVPVGHAAVLRQRLTFSPAKVGRCAVLISALMVPALLT
jgi:hypothetical protein